MKNISSQIKLQLTVPKGYIVTYKGDNTVGNHKYIMKMVKRAEKNNILLSDKLIANLISMDNNDVKDIKEQVFA